MSRKLKTRLPMTKSELKPNMVDEIKHRQQVRDYQMQMKLSYDKHSKECSPMAQNEAVFFKKRPDETWKKGKIVEITGMPRSVIVEDEHGKHYRRNHRDLINDRTTDRSDKIIVTEQSTDKLTLRSGKQVFKNNE